MLLEYARTGLLTLHCLSLTVDYESSIKRSLNIYGILANPTRT